MSEARICLHCRHGEVFKPRPDELKRYGEGVMGCKRPNWEGYTKESSTCEAFYPALTKALQS